MQRRLSTINQRIRFLERADRDAGDKHDAIWPMQTVKADLARAYQ